VALRFGKKKPDDGDGENGNGKEAPPFEPQPEKARQWFDQAKSMADRYNYEAALLYYANGVRLDPKLMSAHEAMYEAGVQYCNRGGKSASGKEIKELSGPHPVDRFAAAEFAWLKDINSGSLAVKFLESTVNAFDWAAEVGRLHAPRVLTVLRRQKKASKSAFLAAKDVLAELGAWDEALAAGEDALRLDPNDAQLENELKDISAQRAMDRGRYEEAVTEEGGFKKFVRASPQELRGVARSSGRDQPVRAAAQGPGDGRDRGAGARHLHEGLRGHRAVPVPGQRR
jgi:tetratricopeptide (TPR) repeat protein